MTQLIIVPGRDFEHDRFGCEFSILNAETGEHLASHFCSGWGFAYGDLYGNRPERQLDWKERFGDIDVKFIDEIDLSEEELLRRNKDWYTSKNQQMTNIPTPKIELTFE